MTPRNLDEVLRDALRALEEVPKAKRTKEQWRVIRELRNQLDVVLDEEAYGG